MEKNQKKIFRELTNKERFLLVLLAMVVIYYLSFRFIIDPQVKKISSLESQRDTYASKIQENNELLKKRKAIIEKKDLFLLEKEEIEEGFFANLSQPEIIFLLNELLLDSQIEMESINFSRPFYEPISDDEEIRKIDISIPYKGSFDDLNKIIKEIEKEPRKIIVNKINMERSQEAEISGSIDLGIYSLMGLVDVDETTTIVEATNDNKSNPFIPYSSYIDPDDLVEEEEDDDREAVDGEIEEEVENPSQDESDKEDYKIYKAVRGDNISFISRRIYGSEKYVDEILQLNGMIRESILPIGKELKLIKK